MTTFYCLRFEALPTWRARSTRNRVAQLYPQALGSLFVASYDTQGYGGGIRTRLHTGSSRSMNFLQIFSNSVRTSQETHYVSATKTNQLKLFIPDAAIFHWNRTEIRYRSERHSNSVHIRKRYHFATSINFIYLPINMQSSWDCFIHLPQITIFLGKFRENNTQRKGQVHNHCLHREPYRTQMYSVGTMEGLGLREMGCGWYGLDWSGSSYGVMEGLWWTW
jgi:hypothetical protein